MVITEQQQCLERLFSHFNHELFNGELTTPAITIQTQGRKSCYGWCTVEKVWSNKHDADISYYEINLSAEHMSRGLNEVATTLVHEMVHLSNLENGIIDCNPKTQNHNTKFKELAEKVHLQCEKVDRKGWATTYPTDRLLQIIKDSNEANIFTTARVQPEKQKKEKKEVFKFKCKCGTEMKSTKELDLICGKCMSKLEKR